MSARILVIEDQEDLAFGIRRNLEFEGYAVDVVHDGRAGLAEALDEAHDLIILDLMLPGIDGMSLLRTLRDRRATTPVLILTARSQERDKVRGLRAGGDDYLTKPFGIAELLARVEALLRRARGAGPSAARPAGESVRAFGSVEVDPHTRSVTRQGQPVPLTPKEYELLLALLDADGGARSRFDLLRDVWGHKAAVGTRTVDTHIGELRKKLEAEPSRPEHILTVRKFGYRLATTPEGAEG